jgi:hypothetical protein
MGRIINGQTLLQALEPLWMQRLAAAGIHEGTLAIETGGGQVAIHLNYYGQEPETNYGLDSTLILNEELFAHLLFHGFDQHIHTFSGSQQEQMLLQTLFPRQNFVIWQADALS